MYIPYGTQSIDEDDIQAVVEVLRSDYLTTGPTVAAFEKKVADYVGAKHAVAVSNGTAALHVACLAAGIKEGDEVITTPITFVASSNCVLYCGGTPVFADINTETYNVDIKDIKRKITKNTKAIIAVHFTGQPCEMDEIHAIAEEHNLLVIEDAAHALGADYKGKMVGNISDMTTFSFHPVKHITTGEGGMITTNSDELYEKLIVYRSHGITRDDKLMTRNEGDWYYQQLELGYNYRITDFQCALGISQMNKLQSFIEKRKEIVKRYNQAFSGIDEIVTPFQQEGCNSSWHLYVIQVVNRKEVFDKLRKSGIGVNVHYIPVYTQPFYQENGYSKVHCDNAEKLYEGLISLPIYAKLSQVEQNYVIEQVKVAVKEIKYRI
ncbi:MAG: UDP-4-amino-4,6-dideoxy-N-acetyl-beta-L-altrosamine transaminase [Lachnotalea sp.]